MEHNTVEIADAIIRQQVLKKHIAIVKSCRLYAVHEQWEADVISKTTQAARSYEEFYDAFTGTNPASIFVRKEAGISLAEIEKLVKSSAQSKNIFIEQ